MALCCSCSSIALFRMSHLFFLNNLLIIVIIVALAVVVFLYWDPMDQKMSSEKDPRLIAVFEISIDFLEINWEFVQQYHDRWPLKRVQMFFPLDHICDHICFVQINLSRIRRRRRRRVVSQIYLILSSWLAFKGAKDDPPPLLASWNCEKSPSISLHLRLHPGSPELPHKIGNSFRNDLLLFVKEIINKRRKEKVVLVEKNLVPELIFVATIATSGRGIFFLAKFHSLTV